MQVQPLNHCSSWCCYSKLYIESVNATIMSFSFIYGLCLVTVPTYCEDSQSTKIPSRSIVFKMCQSYKNLNWVLQKRESETVQGRWKLGCCCNKCQPKLNVCAAKFCNSQCCLFNNPMCLEMRKWQPCASPTMNSFWLTWTQQFWKFFLSTSTELEEMMIRES